MGKVRVGARIKVAVGSKRGTAGRTVLGESNPSLTASASASGNDVLLGASSSDLQESHRSHTTGTGTGADICDGTSSTLGMTEQGANRDIHANHTSSSADFLFENEELITLTKSYKEFSKQLSTLIEDVKKHSDNMSTLSKSNMAVATTMAIMLSTVHGNAPNQLSAIVGDPAQLDSKASSTSSTTAATSSRMIPKSKILSPFHRRRRSVFEMNSNNKVEATSIAEETNGNENNHKNRHDKNEMKNENNDNVNHHTEESSSTAVSDTATNGTSQENVTQISTAAKTTTATLTYMDVHQNWMQQATKAQSKYIKVVVHYVMQWEKAIKPRIQADLKEAETLRVELVHYHAKVESLRQQVESIISKGKRPKDELQEKLERNVQKLDESRQAHEDFVTNFILLLKQVVHHSWRDVQPLLIEMMRFDIQQSADQAKALQKLKTIVGEVKTIGQVRGVSQKGRLADLKSKTPMELTLATQEEQPPLSSPRSKKGKKNSKKSLKKSSQTKAKLRAVANDNPTEADAHLKSEPAAGQASQTEPDTDIEVAAIAEKNEKVSETGTAEESAHLSTSSLSIDPFPQKEENMEKDNRATTFLTQASSPGPTEYTTPFTTSRSTTCDDGQTMNDETTNTSNQNNSNSNSNESNIIFQVSSSSMNHDIGPSDSDSPEPKLYVACATGDNEWLRQYLQSHAYAVNQADEEHKTPLSIASRCGHIMCIQVLLEHGADVNAIDQQGCVPLHHASEKGFDDCVQTLLDHAATVTVMDDEGFTPLHLASENGHAIIVEMLLQKDPKSVDQANPDGWRPLHLATQNGHVDCLKLLVEEGHAIIAKLSGDQFTALHLASANGYEACIRLLLENGATLDDTDRSGSTPLQKATEKGHVECVRLLLQHKANPNKMDNEGYTPLIATALEGNLEIMKVLLQHGADVDEAHPDGWTPLHLAADYGFADCIEHLLEYKANIQAENEDGWTALHKAAEQGHLDCLEILLKNGADLLTANNDGFNALHVAAFNGHANCVELLLNHSPRTLLNSQDINGCTPLYWAAREGQVECVELLVQHDADTTIVDLEGNTPAKAAEENGHMECVELCC